MCPLTPYTAWHRLRRPHACEQQARSRWWIALRHRVHERDVGALHRSHKEKSFWMVMGSGTPRRLAVSHIIVTPYAVSLLRPQYRILPALIKSVIA